MSMNRGLFPFAILAILVGMMIWRMPSGDVTKLAFALLNRASDGSLIGWILFALSTGGWAIHVRLQRRSIGGEMTRVSQERNKAQSRALNRNVGSSDS